jgi:hypothetical protein
MANDGIVLSDTWRRLLCRGLKDLRDDGHLCDTRILAAGNVQLNAHAVILSASSPYFRSLFSSVKQGFFTVRIDHVTSDVLVNVLHFIYTGELRIGACAMSELVSVAKQLELRKLESLCTELQKSRDEKNLSRYKSNEDIADYSHATDQNSDSFAISSLTGSWTTVANGNRNHEFKSPQGGSSRTSTPMTPASRTPTPKTIASAPSAQRNVAVTAVNNSGRGRMVSTTGAANTAWNSQVSAVSPRSSKASTSTAVALESMPNSNSTNFSNASTGVNSGRTAGSSLAAALTSRPTPFANNSAHPLLPKLRTQNQFDGKVRPFTCYICGRKYGSSKGLNWHIQAHHGVFANRRNLSTASAPSAGNERKPQCKICGRFFPQLNYLHLHEKCHRTTAETGRKPQYTSPLISIGYQRHKPDESGRYVCRVCGRAFLRSQALGSHMWCHLPQGRHGKRQLKRSSDPGGYFDSLPPDSASTSAEIGEINDAVPIADDCDDNDDDIELVPKVENSGEFAEGRAASIEQLTLAKEFL